MRKATCQENDTCVWIVGKGCREQRNMQKKLDTWEPKPKPKPPNNTNHKPKNNNNPPPSNHKSTNPKNNTTLKLPTNTTLKTCQFHIPKILINYEFDEFSRDQKFDIKVPKFFEKLLKRFFKHMFGSSKTETYTIETLKDLMFTTLKSREIANNSHSLGSKIVKIAHSDVSKMKSLKNERKLYNIIKQALIQASFVNRNNNTIFLSDDVKIYLTAVVDYFLFQFIEKGGQLTQYKNLVQNKNLDTVTVALITEAIRNDSELVDFAKLL